MPPPTIAQQKVLIAQFVALTGATERNATRYLKTSGFKMNEAVDSYFASNTDSNGPSLLESKLESLFSELRNDATDEKDKMGLEATMTYFSEVLEVDMETAEFLVAVELVQSPTVGEIQKKGYVDGWKLTGVGASHKEHAAYLEKQISALSTDAALFKKVYRHTFVAGRENSQKALSLENALIYWSILFSAPGMPWKSKNHDWLELWKEFLGENYSRSVSKDMWNMTLEFAFKSMKDETLSFWSEDGAWPGVIDDFVEWCRGKGIGKADGMDVDN